MFKNFRNSWIA